LPWISLDHLSQLETAHEQQLSTRITFVDLGNFDQIESVQLLNHALVNEFEDFNASNALEFPIQSLPSPLLDEAEPKRGALAKGLFEFFSGMNLRDESQCFHRAYLWAHEAWTKKSLATEKVFLFFTRNYIRTYRYKWWFHVAPYVVDGEREFVLDPTYLAAPIEVKAWTAHFVTDGTNCPLIDRYLGLQAQHQDRSCYIRKTSMYYYHPNNIEKADRKGQAIQDWDRNGLFFSARARPRP
jgi:hypothetical protein